MPIHEEIAIRWDNYLRKGLPKEQREELSKKYKVPNNCKALLPPAVNGEILHCLPKTSVDHDRFMSALQQQLAISLAAVGRVIEATMPVPEQSDNLAALADASQLLTNVHYSISLHRRFKIIPHLNIDCKKVAKSSNIDEYLFSKDFTETVKNEQAMKKTSSGFKKKIWQPQNSLPGTSSGITSTRYLNYQRPQFKFKMRDKRREDRRSSDYLRARTQKKEAARHYRQK